ncbi:hypothetical protein QOK77_06510 [Moraxella osloensis]|nr:hypothetical protein [Moraxella osloensis]MDK1670221.1 hypothetical protein [Moraxella osloensis]
MTSFLFLSGQKSNILACLVSLNYFMGLANGFLAIKAALIHEKFVMLWVSHFLFLGEYHAIVK